MRGAGKGKAGKEVWDQGERKHRGQVVTGGGLGFQGQSCYQVVPHGDPGGGLSWRGFETKGRTWRPDLEWVVNATNFQKIIDGKYAK